MRAHSLISLGSRFLILRKLGNWETGKPGNWETLSLYQRIPIAIGIALPIFQVALL